MNKTILFVFIAFLAFSCKKGEKHANLPPETKLAFESINLSGENRLNSTVQLSWFGTDKDGFVQGYEISFDNKNWYFVTTVDSTFQFPLEAGKDTTDIHFYVRSIDNLNEPDPTPAYLKIPLKNSPPSVSFIKAALPPDTNHLVATFVWRATDPDGDASINQVQLKVNNGNWVNIPVTANLISIIPENPQTTGITQAKIFTEGNFLSQKLTGFNANGVNTFYIKVFDIALAESIEDTSNTVFISSQNTSELLFISGQDAIVTGKYKNLLLGINFDFLDYKIAEKQPKFWDPTFQLIINNYDRVFVHADANDFINPYNQQSGLLLDFMTPALQQFLSNGGKIFVTTAFKRENDLSQISEVFPIASVSPSNGQARIVSDSTIYPINLSGTWQSVSPTNIVVGASPMNITPDAEAIYLGELTKVSGWTGPNIVGAIKRNGAGDITQVFFSVELHRFDKDAVAQKDLITKLLNLIGL